MNYERELIKRGIELKIYENEYRNALILCPFHEDVNASCSVNLDKGFFHCFACGESGSFSKLIAALDGISETAIQQRFIEEKSIEEVIDNMSVQIESGLQKSSTKVFSKTSFFKMFPSVLKSEKAITYLKKKRRITRLQTIKVFNIRVGMKGKWKDRIIFPIRNTKGKIISWVGRSFVNVEPKTRKVKSSHIKSILFGLYELQKQHIQGNYLLLVEGEVDAAYLQQFNLRAVAIMGTGTARFEEERKALILKHCDRVFISYDGDKGGRDAVEKTFDSLKDVVPVEIINLVDGKDPNDLTIGEVKSTYGFLLDV